MPIARHRHDTKAAKLAGKIRARAVHSIHLRLEHKLMKMSDAQAIRIVNAAAKQPCRKQERDRSPLLDELDVSMFGGATQGLPGPTDGGSPRHCDQQG